MYETGFSYTFKSMKKQETLFYAYQSTSALDKDKNCG